MNANVSFRQMDSSPALRDYAVKKLERVVDKYVHGRVDASIVMRVEKFRHIVNFTVNIKNLTVKGDSSSEDMYSSVDLALDKIERQLRRHKDRIRDHKPSKGDRSRPFTMSVIQPPTLEQESEIDEDFAQDYADYGEAAAPVEAAEAISEAIAEAEEATPLTDPGDQTFTSSKGEEITLVRRGDYVAKSLSVEEAVIQLDLMEDRQFFVFTNAETDSINIVHRRADGSFGLIET
jgi:putative sigma-54 modulation protein